MKTFILLTFFSFLYILSEAQLPCDVMPSTTIYIHNGSNIYNYDVSQPISATNPVLNTINAPGGGLAVANNLNGPGPSPTFYTVISSNYHYWDGATWINTGHTAGGVNPGGAGNYIYNLVGGTGQVWKYDGTGNAVLLMTVPNFNGGGPYDIVGDDCGNFYVLNTTVPNQQLLKIDSNGNILNTWTSTGPSSSAGGGFAIIGDTVYYHNSSGFCKGVLDNINNTISFTVQSITIPSPSDMAVCFVPANCTTPVLPPVADFGMSDSVICEGDCINFTDLSTGMPTSWSWSINGGTPLVSALQNPTGCFNMAGSYNVTLIVGNAGGTDTVIKPVTVLPTPVLTTSPDTMICSGNSVTLGASAIPSGAYSWNTGSQMSTIQVTPSVSTTYTVMASIGQCRDTAFITVDVTPQPAAVITGDMEICEGESTVLKASPPFISYLWNTGSTDDSVVVSPTTSTTYSIVVQNGICADSTSAFVQVNQNPQVQVITELTNCDENTGTAEAIVTGGTPNYTYDWSSGQGTAVINGLGVGNYMVQVTDSKGCTTQSGGTVSMHAPPIVTISPYPETFIRIGDTAFLAASGASSYVWNPGIGLTCPSCNTTLALPLHDEWYCVTGTNDYGCIDTACVTVHVDTSCNQIYVPNAFTPNGDGVNDYIEVKNRCMKSLTFKVFNRWGQLIYESKSLDAKWDGAYQGEPQPISTYFYILESELINGRKIRLRGDITLIR